MDREESDELVACGDCGARIVPETGQGFSYGEGEALCWECATRRGGSYDARQDRSTTAPDIGDLPDERRPHD